MSERRRKRHGRVRRWLVRPIFWGLALAALLVLAGYLILGSRQLQERAARWAEARATALLERPVSIGELRFEILPLTVELDDLVVGGREPGEPPLASVPHVTVDAQLFRRGGWRLELRSVRLDEPVFQLIFDPGEGSNVAQLGANLPRREGSRQGSFQFALEELTVHRGTLVVDHQRLPLDLSARGLRGRFWGTEEPQFEAEVRELETTLPRARPYLGAASVRGRLDGRNLEILQGHIEGPDLSIATTGRFRFGEDRGGALELAVETGADFLRRVGYVSDQLAGEFDFGGTVFWDAEGWEVQGAMASRALRVLNFPLQRVQGVFNGNREQLELEIQHSEYADGLLTGIVGVDLDVGRPPVVVVDLELDEVDFELLLAGQGWPVAGVSSRVSGPFSYGFNWPQPDRGAGWANLRVTGRRGGVAFNGSVPLLIQDGMFRTKATRLISLDHQLEAAGFYHLEARTGEFEFRVETERVEQLLPLLDLAGDPADLWRPTAGRGEVAGELNVRPAGTRVDLRLDLADVRSAGASADQLRGMLGIDGEGIRRMRLELLRPDAGLIVTGRVPFAEPSEEDAAGFVVSLDAVGWPLEEARVWLPFELPVAGPSFGSVHLEGAADNPAGSARLEVRSGELFEVPVETLLAEMRFDLDVVDFETLQVQTPAGEIAAQGRWSRLDDQLSLEIRSTGLDLEREPFAGWWGASLGGRLDVQGQVSGTLAAPHLAGRVDASGMRLEGVALGDSGVAGLELSWREGRVAALGSVLGLVEVNGGGRLDQEAVDLELAVEAPDLRALAHLFGLVSDFEFAGSGSGTLAMSGRPGIDDSWNTGLRLDRLELEHRGHRLSSARPVELALTPSKVVIESLYLVEAETGNDVYLVGDIGLEANAPVDLRLQSSVDTVLASYLLPEFDLDGGRFDLLAVIGGTLGEMRINGQGEVQGARVILGDLPPLESTRGLVLFYPKRVVLDSVRGRFGGGMLRVGGTINLPAEVEEYDYSMQIRAERVTLRYPEGWEMLGSGDLALVSAGAGKQELRGAIGLDRAAYSRRVDVGLTQLLQSLFQRRRLQVESTDEALTAIRLNLDIDGPGALRIRNNIANLRGDLDLVLRGSLAAPVLFGRLDLEAGGSLQIGGSDYTVERGSLTFANPYRTEPIIDLAAKTRRRDYDLSLSLSGTPERLNASLASDPPLADLDVLGLLTTGEPAAIQGPAQGAGAFLVGQAATAVGERVNRLFDLDRFRIDPLTGSSGSLSSARVTVGKQLSRDLLATYSYDPSLTELQFLQLEWNVARGLTLVLTQNGDGTYAVDSRWEKSF